MILIGYEKTNQIDFFRTGVVEKKINGGDKITKISQKYNKKHKNKTYQHNKMKDKIDEELKFKINSTKLEREISKLVLSKDDEPYNVLVSTILPSCLFHWILNEKDTLMHICPFKDCYKISLQPRLAKKHLKDHHSNDIPTGMFDYDKCETCNVTFANKQNLKNHMRSRMHVFKAIKKGTANTEEEGLYNSIIYAQGQRDILKKKQQSRTDVVSHSQTDNSSVSSSQERIQKDTSKKNSEENATVKTEKTEDSTNNANLISSQLTQRSSKESKRNHSDMENENDAYNNKENIENGSDPKRKKCLDADNTDWKLENLMHSIENACSQ